MTDASPKGIDMADLSADEIAASIIKAALAECQLIKATPYDWPNPKKLPRRLWLFGHWLLVGEITLMIAPGGAGKSTIATDIALALASGRELLGKQLYRGPQNVWLYNLEDGRTELERQFGAARIHHALTPLECGKRLFVNSGMDQPLCLAAEDKHGFKIVEKEFFALAKVISTNKIGVMIIDPFASCHAASENSNEAMNRLVKRLKKLAHDTGCAILIVHHSKKLSGKEVTAEDGRGAVALRDAARVVLTLNPMSQTEADALGIGGSQLRQSLVRIDVGKSNRASKGDTTWIRLTGQDLGNGSPAEPPDIVGVATLWKKPDVMDGVTDTHIANIQQQVTVGKWRKNVQAKNWIGYLVAEILALSIADDKSRINKIVVRLIEKGLLVEKSLPDEKGTARIHIVKGIHVKPIASKKPASLLSKLKLPNMGKSGSGDPG